MNILTWNIHGFVGSGGRFDPERTADRVREAGAEIVALQEVDTRGERHAALEPLLEDGSWQSVAAPTMEDEQGWYGQLFLSKHPICSSTVHDLSVPGFEPRRLIEAVVETPLGEIAFYAAHLGLNRKERRQQLVVMRDAIGDAQARTTIVFGDFNEWLRKIPHLTDLIEDETAPTRSIQRTFPARFPVLALDRIMCVPVNLLQKLEVVRSDPGASDHLPVRGIIAHPHP